MQDKHTNWKLGVQFDAPERSDDQCDAYAMYTVVVVVRYKLRLVGDSA